MIIIPTKKHCQRHYRYVANCPDCRAVNEDDASPPSQSTRASNSDGFESEDRGSTLRASPGSSPEIPNVDDDFEHSPPPTRYHYQRIPNRYSKKVSLIVLIVIGFIALIIGIYGYPLWHAKILLQEQLYTNKADVDFWALYTLNYWSTNFFFNKTGLIGAIIGCIIWSIPPDTNFLALLGTKFGWGRPSQKKALIFWWTIGFGMFYIFGQVLDAGYFSLTMYMIETGALPVASDSYLKAMTIFTSPGSVGPIDMYIYSSITNPIIMYILVLIIFRLILGIVENSYLVKNNYRVTGNIFELIGIFFGMGYFNRVLEPLDELDIIQSYSVLFGFIGFLALGVLINAFSIRQARYKQYSFNGMERKRAGIFAISIFVILLVPAMISIPKAILIDNEYQTWYDSRWKVQIERAISWTQSAAGTGDFTTQPIQDYIDEVQTSDLSIVNSMRQYDKTIASKRMEASIRTKFETIADADIIFNSGHGGGEYWVAPKTIDTGETAVDPVNRHTEIYDHVEGFLALDTSSGDFLPESQYQQVFGISSDYPIYFGEEAESISTSTSTGSYTNEELLTTFGSINAFSDDILLYSGWGENNTAYKYRYNGEPDGNLTGIEAFWFTYDLGLTGNALDGTEKSFLVNRNIKDRVNAILLPGLWIDSDPYLCFDRQSGRLYYAVSIITSLSIGSYAQSPLLRFLGVCLIDVKTGDLLFYKNPTLDSTQDPLYTLWSLYMDVYPWQSLPNWLKDQLRYPESLWETQLSIDYIYHVNDPQTYFSGNDFYARPDGGDAFYIEMDIGDGLEYLGIDIVEFETADASTLAGFYLVRHGDHFGEIIFYKTDKTALKLIGPMTAKEELKTRATQEFQLISNPRIGNTILYPLAGSLYYFIPIYASSANIEQLVLAGLVNADTKATGWGSSAYNAFLDLNVSLPVNQTNNVTLTVSGDNNIVYDPLKWAEFKAIIDVIDTNDTHPAQSYVLNLTIFHETGAEVRVSNTWATNSSFTSSLGNGYNYTIFGPTTLNPGEGVIRTVKITKDPGTFASISFWYRFDLYQDNKLVGTTGLRILTIRNEQTP